MTENNFAKGLKALLFICLPFIVTYLIWFYWMEPATYWQKLVSTIGSFITLIITFYSEIELS
jgi:hypothetical protein